jgi:hypothetical protein
MTLGKFAVPIRVCRAILASLVRDHQSIDVCHSNLLRAHRDQSPARAKNAIRMLTAISLQAVAYDKTLSDLQLLEQASRTGRIAKADLKALVGPALRRLRASAKLLPMKDFLKQLNRFPKAGTHEEPLSHDYSCLVARAQPLEQEIALFLPALAQQVAVPIEFLEDAVELKAAYELGGELPMAVPFNSELFQTVELHF